MTIFSEIYGSYYKAVAEILKAALAGGGASRQELRPIIEKHAFSESLLEIEPAIAEERWQVIRADGVTAISHPPTVPLSELEKRWLKAISLDPRIRLFDADFSWLGDTEPLFTPEDFCVFDKYGDGDPYEDPEYVKNFRLILNAVRERQPLRIGIPNRQNTTTHLSVVPRYLEYSEKDDKFRLIASGSRHLFTVNLGRILYCRRLNERIETAEENREDGERSVTLTVTDERNALERVLLHFAHFAKEARRIDETHYSVTVRYDKDDETEMVIRVLSFGPMIHVTGPDGFAELIRDRLKRQKSCGL